MKKREGNTRKKWLDYKSQKKLRQKDRDQKMKLDKGSRKNLRDNCSYNEKSKRRWKKRIKHWLMSFKNNQINLMLTYELQENYWNCIHNQEGKAEAKMWIGQIKTIITLTIQIFRVRAKIPRKIEILHLQMKMRTKNKKTTTLRRKVAVAILMTIIQTIPRAHLQSSMNKHHFHSKARVMKKDFQFMLQSSA